jgi:uncharacterized protein YoxC
MSQAPLWVSVALLAILVAVAVPTLLQLRKTLTTADHALEIAERRLGGVMNELTETLSHVNRAAEEIERVTKSVGGVVNTFHRVGSPLQRLKSSVRSVSAVSAAVGPMLVAALRGAFGWRDQGAYERHRLPVTEEMQ